ncbi:MAG: hypothetical protein CH104c_0610 [Candidatus Woesebacteria bacterium]|nr:MAG: hypothetical protein CH104c_0610 [Candidatus Woesebacteria bacterium]
MFTLERYAAPKNTPVFKASLVEMRFLIEMVKKRQAVICPKYQEEPTEERNQIIFPAPEIIEDQRASFKSFLILRARLKTTTGIKAPRI